MEPQQNSYILYRHFFLQNEFEEAQRYFLEQMGQYPSQLRWEAIKQEPYLFAFNAWCRFSILLGECAKPFEELLYLQKNYNFLLGYTAPSHYAESLHYLADIHFYLGQYPRSTVCSRQAYTLKSQSPHYEAPGLSKELMLGRALMVAGKGYWKNGDAYQALRLYMRSLLHFKKASDNDNEVYFYVGRLICLIGQVYIDQGKPGFARQLLEKGLDILQQHLPVAHHLYIGAAQNILGKAMVAEAAENQETNDAALAMLKTAEQNLYRAVNGRSHRYRASVVGNQAFYFDRKALPFSDESLNQEALKLYYDEIGLRKMAFGGIHHPTISTAYLHIATLLHSRKRSFEPAAQAAQQAIIAVDRNFRLNSIFKNPRLESDKIDSLPKLLTALSVKAKALWELYRVAEEPKYLKPALKTIRLAIALCEKMRKNLSTEEVKLEFGKNAKPIHELALKMLWADRNRQIKKGKKKRVKERNEEIFQVMQRTKSVLLLETLKRAEFQREHQEEESSFFVDFKTLQTLIRVNLLESNTTFNEIELKKLDNVLQNIQKTINSTYKRANDELKFIRNMDPALEEEDPQNKTPLITLEQLGKKFTGGEPGMIISYLISDTNIYVMLIKSDGSSFDFVRLPFAVDSTYEVQRMKDIVLQLIAELNDINNSSISNKLKDNFSIYQGITELHRMLIAPLKLDGVKRLYIIPDEELFFLPFEMLAPKVEDIVELAVDQDALISKLDFLIKDYQITYHHSVAILYGFHANDGRRNHGAAPSEDKLLSVATPGTITDGDFIYKIEHNVQEGIEQVAKALLPEVHSGNHLYFGDKKKSIKRKDIIDQLRVCTVAHFFVHTATQDELNHSPAIILGENDKTEGTAYQKNLLTQDQIKACKINKGLKLLLLNTCLGGWGSIDRSEGITSLAKAFLWSGTSNIYYTLFRINSHAAKVMAVSFVEKLSLEGITYGRALQLAKQEMIKDLVYCHPCLWAAPVFMGNQLGRFGGRAVGLLV